MLFSHIATHRHTQVLLALCMLAGIEITKRTQSKQREKEQKRSFQEM
jgi:hypothetical protein